MDAAGPADFRDIAASAGLTAKTIIGGDRTKQYILETTGGGTAILDYDDDGWPDIFLVNGAPLEKPAGDAAPMSHLYRNSGDGTFADVTAKAGIGGRGWGQGVCAGDYDNDGHVDLFVTYYGDQMLYRNNGDGTFGDVTRRTGLSLSSPRWNTGCAFVDFNRDGRLDLFVSAYVAYADAMRYAPGSRGNCNWKGLGVMCGPHGLEGSHNLLFRANDDGTFTDVSEAAGLKKARPAFGFTPLVLDYDNDRWPDVYVANDSNASLLFHNDGRRHVQGRRRTGGRGPDGRRPRAGRHGRQRRRLRPRRLARHRQDELRRRHDVALSQSGRRHVRRCDGGRRTRGRTPGIWAGARRSSTSISTPGRTSSSSTGTSIRRRIASAAAIAYQQPRLLYRNLGNGRFEDLSMRAGPGVLAKSAARGAAFGDLFNTGQQDVVVNNMHGTPSLLRNCATPAGHGLVVKLEGTRSNRSAIGARVTVQVAGRRLIDEVRSGGSFCSQNDFRIHFGLGARDRADRIEVAWPSGATETIDGASADQLVVIREGSGVVQRRPFGRPTVAGCAAP